MLFQTRCTKCLNFNSDSPCSSFFDSSGRKASAFSYSNVRVKCFQSSHVARVKAVAFISGADGEFHTVLSCPPTPSFSVGTNPRTSVSMTIKGTCVSPSHSPKGPFINITSCSHNIFLFSPRIFLSIVHQVPASHYMPPEGLNFHPLSVQIAHRNSTPPAPVMLLGQSSPEQARDTATA